MTTKLLTEIEDSHEEVAAPAWTAVTEATELQRELYPSEKKRTLIGVNVSHETKAQWDTWVHEHDTTTTAVLKTLIHLLFHNEIVARITIDHLPEKDELAEILKAYSPTQRAKLAALLRGKNDLATK